MAVGPYRASGSTRQNVQLRAIHAKLPRTLKSTARLKRHTSWYCNPGAAVTQNKPALPARKPSGEKIAGTRTRTRQRAGIASHAVRFA
jgi:sulfite reductase beta subunit-like hemoprotein